MGAQEYVQVALLSIVLIWLILDSRRNRRRGPYVTSKPEFVRGSGTKKNPYILQSPNVMPAGGAALSQEVITLRKVGDNAIRTVTGPQFDISAVEQPHDVDYSKDDDTMVIRLKVDDRDPDDWTRGLRIHAFLQDSREDPFPLAYHRRLSKGETKPLEHT